MPKLTIDNREIEVPAGTKVIEAAERLGIMVPRFCYHPALGSVGACRVCAVTFKDGPVKGVQMSCMVDAQNEMVVSTTDAEAVAFRKSVIEWLMMNHPHDCPVCDEGGHCLLQDLTVAGGHGLRRYPGLKRTHNDQYLGPLLQHEMNRCIQCYRCSRYYQEYTGYRDLGVMGIGSRIYFGRSKPGRLQSPFSGNLSDICPTGVYTDKPSRYFGRRWEYERTPSICLHCSLGCNLVASVRYRKVARHEARPNSRVNGHFICDRGRYGYAYASDNDRPRQGLCNGKAERADDACVQAGKALAKIADRYGGDSIAAVGSSRSSIETLAALLYGCRVNKWLGPAVSLTSRRAENLAAAVSSLKSANPVSQQDISTADEILVVGADPLNEAPMLALSLRQAQRKGSRVTVIDPRGIELPLIFCHRAVHPGKLQITLADLLRAFKEGGKESGTDTSSHPDGANEVYEMARQLRNAKIGAVICGTDMVTCESVGLAAELASAMTEAQIESGLFYTMSGANDFAVGLMAAARQEALSIDRILGQIEAEKIRALIVVESDLWSSYPDRGRLTDALKRLELLIVLDYVASPLIEQARFFIPTQTIYEAGGHWVNNEGRLQTASQCFRGGASIEITGKQDHPPRVFESQIPGVAPLIAWQALEKLVRGSSKSSLSTSEDYLAKAVNDFHPALSGMDDTGGGLRLNLPASSMQQEQCAGGYDAGRTESESGEITLLLVDWTFGTEPLSAMNPVLSQDQGKPAARMHPEDIGRLELGEDKNIIIETDTGSIEMPLAADGRMAPGIVVIPRHHLLHWQIFDDTVVKLNPEQISSR